MTPARLRRYSSRRTTPTVYATTTHTTNMVKRAADFIVEDRSVAVSEIATDSRAIAMFRYSETGDPRSSVSSSPSETS
jgi:polyhydroxyalkanoate synthesis regulator protein